MKKVRIMLMSICLVAIAGGVLAFKAMTPQDYCTREATTTLQAGQTIWTCTDPNSGIVRDCGSIPDPLYITATTASINFFCYTVPDGDAQPCRNGVLPGSPLKKCDLKATTTVEPPAE